MSGCSIVTGPVPGLLHRIVELHDGFVLAQERTGTRWGTEVLEQRLELRL